MSDSAIYCRACDGEITVGDVDAGHCPHCSATLSDAPARSKPVLPLPRAAYHCLPRVW